ncbi:UNVERIFIED_CONTAM: hypothetical protein GTU68_012125 [Idotea baltica]|nr:hypothetical protein [Idotea baltica]
MARKIIIAVDGYSSCGKSTLARDLAIKLNYKYIDTGAMYRAVTLYMIQNEVDIKDIDAVKSALGKMKLDVLLDEESKQMETILNEIVSQNVSPVSAIKEVRDMVVSQQQQIGTNRGVVMDGRDIGTVVFPDAELKIFLTADVETRTRRRFVELQGSNPEEMTEEEVKQNLMERDYIDTHREESPLYKADDAVLLDNTILTRPQQLKLVLNMAQNIIEAKSVA